MRIGCFWRKKYGFSPRLGIELSGAWTGGYLHFWWVTLFVVCKETP